MRMLSAGRVALAVVAAFAVGCGSRGDSGRLRRMNEVYVPLKTASLMSLQEALEKKGYGNVMASDFKPQYYFADVTLGGKQGKALVAYSEASLVPSEKLYQPMKVSQCIAAALDDKTAIGLVVDPEIKDRTFVLSRSQIASVLESLTL